MNQTEKPKQTDDIFEQFARWPKMNEGDYIDENGYICCGVCGKPRQKPFPIEGEQRDLLFPWPCDCYMHEFLILMGVDDEEFPEDEPPPADSAPAANGLDARLREMTFDTDDGSGDRQAAGIAAQYARHWGAMQRENIGLLITGLPGSGKTFLACAIANALIAQGVDVYLTSIPALVSRMTAHFGDDREQVLEEVRRPELLVLDDVGAPRHTAADEKLFEIIDARYRCARPLIVTTSLPLRRLCHPKTLEEKRVFDRLLEMCQPVCVRGESRRMDIAREKSKTVRALLTKQ